MGVNKSNSHSSVVKPMAENHEIFDNARVTELALKWKALTKENKHGEAMPVLEEIIRLCEHMFLRLAQYEGFTNTVDLSTLVQSAREKVPRWLIGWDPTYKSNNGIFSWFSKSLAGDTPVLLSDGTCKPINKLVEQKYSGCVPSYSGGCGKLVPSYGGRVKDELIVDSQVTHWHKHPASPDTWRLVTVSHPCGFNQELTITHDHEVLSTRGWVKADDLVADDGIYARATVFTPAGIEALTGLYLSPIKWSDSDQLQFVVGPYSLDEAAQLAEEFGGHITVKETSRLKIHGVAMSGKFQSCSWKRLPKNKKVGIQVLDKLTGTALAVWYQVAGQTNADKSTQLNLGRFAPSDVDQIVSCLSLRHGLHAKVVKIGGRAAIVIPSSQQAAFAKLTFAENTPVFARDTLVACGQSVRPSPRARALKWKYDVTVDRTENFLVPALYSDAATVLHNCSKHAFLSEIAKLNQHRKRFHATGDNLEKFFGAEDHTAFKEEAASDVRRKLADITVRWGDPQEIGAVRYILECLVEDRDADSKPDKEVVIRSASYAWCVSPELSRFFYDWALFALRDALHHKIHVPFTQQDLLRNRESYTFLVDMIDIVGWDRFKRLIVTLGGQRLRLPTLQQLARLHADYLMSQEIDKSDLDPDSVEQVGKKHGRSAKAAAEIYAEMVEITNPRRSGEHSLYPDPSEEHHDSDN